MGVGQRQGKEGRCLGVGRDERPGWKGAKTRKAGRLSGTGCRLSCFQAVLGPGAGGRGAPATADTQNELQMWQLSHGLGR